MVTTKDKRSGVVAKSGQRVLAEYLVKKLKRDGAPKTERRPSRIRPKRPRLYAELPDGTKGRGRNMTPPGQNPEWEKNPGKWDRLGSQWTRRKK